MIPKKRSINKPKSGWIVISIKQRELYKPVRKLERNIKFSFFVYVRRNIPDQTHSTDKTGSILVLLIILKATPKAHSMEDIKVNIL